MNKKNTSVLLAIVLVTLSLVGSGCGRIASPASILEDATYRQQEEEKEHDRRWKARRLAQDCNWEVWRIEQKKLIARTLAQYCSWEVARKQEREVTHRKKEARRLATDCRLEVARRKHEKWKARWIAGDCSREAIRRQERNEQEFALMLADNPNQRLGLSIVDQLVICNLIKKNYPIEEICGVTSYTPEQIKSSYVAYQEWEEALLVAQMRQLLWQEESIKRFLSMDYPTYLLEIDRDEAHNAIMSCHTIAAIRTLGLTDPNLENPMRAQRVSELADYLMKKQRAKTKKHMYKKLLSGNWSIDRCIDSLDPSFSSYEVKRLKKVFCSPAFPIEVADHIHTYDEDLCLPKMFSPYSYNTGNLSMIVLRDR